MAIVLTVYINVVVCDRLVNVVIAVGRQASKCCICCRVTGLSVYSPVVQLLGVFPCVFLMLLISLSEIMGAAEILFRAHVQIVVVQQNRV